jgi:hypothetical protein
VFGAVIFFAIHSFAGEGEIRPKAMNLYQLVTGEDSDGDRGHWDQLFKSDTYVFGKEPALFLREVVGRLPHGGRALDIAMSEGRNGVFLARQGLTVDGVDFSDEALRKARRLAREYKVKINAINADLNGYVIKAESYDVIVNINFLLRGLIPGIKRGLKRGGLVVFESWTVDQLKNSNGQGLLRDYLLAKGELKEMFADFEILLYRETNDGKNAVASLLARKK